MTEDAPKAGPDKTLRWMIGIIVVVVAMVVGYLVYRWAVRRGVEERYAAIRAAGEPVTLKELDAWYPTPPPGLNGATVYQQAFLKFSLPEEIDYKKLPIVDVAILPELGEPIPPEMLAAIREYLAANDEALGLLHEAAAYEECRYPINTSTGAAMLLPHLAQVRQGARLLYLEAILKTEDGDAEGAVEAIQASLAIGDSLRNEPLVISRLVQIACNAITRASFERVLSRMELADAQLSALMDAFKNAEASEGMYRAFVGERCAGIAILENPAGAAASGMPSAVAFKSIGLLNMEAKNYIDIMNLNIAASKASLAERHALSGEVAKRMGELPRWCIFSAMLLPALNSALDKDTSSVAKLRCAATAAAVERYRLAHGNLPATLSDIVPEFVPEIPTDPFTGALLLYKLTEDGCIIYSVGDNGEDDGGVEYASYVEGRGRGKQLDLPFRLLNRGQAAEE